MLFDISLRAEQSLFFAAPERDADRPARFDAERFSESRGFHHHRTADRIVGRAGRGVPRIEMPAEHDHFVFFVGAGDFADRVVRGRAFGKDAIDDVEFELDRRAVGQNARDAAEILIAHDDGRDGFCDIESAVVKSADLPVLAPGVIDPDQRAILEQKIVESFADLACVSVPGGGCC